MNILTFDNVYLNYFGHRDSIIGFSHTFSDGLNVLYGEEGSGKTSLLKLIAGINSPTKGEILLNGGRLDFKSDVQMVFDDLALFERRSLKYNLEYPLKLRKTPKSEIQKKVSDGLEIFGVSPILLSSKVFRLKNVDRVKSALIRCTYRNTPILLLDNPLKSLDRDERKRMFLKLCAYLSKREGIIIYATDSAEEVSLLNLPTTILSYGYKQDSGYPQELLTTPNCLFTAQGLIPYFNTLDGTLENGILKTELCSIPLELFGTLAEGYDGRRVIVGIPYTAIKGKLPKEKSYTLCGDNKIDVYDMSGNTLFVSRGDDELVIDSSKVLLFDIQSERLIYPQKSNTTL